MSDAIALSVDFECFSHTPAYRRASGSVSDPSIGIGAAQYFIRLLRENAATATFFVVSEVAERHPQTIESIADRGHEIGSHSHQHTLLTELDRNDRSQELSRSRDILASITTQPIDGFRAPAFEIPECHFEEVQSANYVYDASIAPCRKIPYWYGGEYAIDRPTVASSLRDGAPDFPVVPVSVMPGLRLPLSGAWMRLFGRQYTLSGIYWLQQRGITPVLYVHPWEFVDLPIVEGVPRRVYWRTGQWMRQTVELILERVPETVTVGELVLDENTGDPFSSDSE